MSTAPADKSKSFTIHTADLSYTRCIGGQIVEQGHLKHPRVVDTLCGYFTHIGYKVTRKKGSRGNTMPSTQQKVYNHQRDVLRQLWAGTLEPEALNGRTRSSLQKRGLLDASLQITPAGYSFMAEAPEEPAPAADPESTEVLEVVVEEDPACEARHALRDLRDSSLGLVENILAEKAPEALPVMASIRRANQILGE